MRRILFVAAVAISASAVVSTSADSYPIVDGISISDVTVSEPTGTGDGLANFTVSLSKTFTNKVTVKATAVPGTALLGRDFRKASVTLTFSPGQTSKNVAVRIVGDDIVEGAETFTVVLTKPTGTVLVDDTGVGTISADPALPVVSINDAPAVNEPPSSASVSAQFTVSLSKPWGRKVSVKVATAPGTALAGKDYTTKSSTLTFNPGETSKPFSVRLVGDDAVEGAETFAVNLSLPKAVTIGDGSGVGTILADPALPIVSVGNATAVNEPTGNAKISASFTVTLSKTWGKDVKVKVTTVGGTATSGKDFTKVTTTLTFRPGQTVKVVSVPIKKDNLTEGAETFSVVLSAPTRAVLGTSSGLGTINAS